MTGLPEVAVRAVAEPPAGWDELLTRVPGAEITAGLAWTRLAARHYRGARSLWFLAEHDGTLVGGLPAVVRRRRGLDRIESSLDSTCAGPQVPADLPAELREATVRALTAAVADRVGGRTLVAAFTVAGQAAMPVDARWRREAFPAGVVDCRGGLDHVGRRLWTNNRRNERNRGLKRGCTVHAGTDPAAVAAWYPLYLAEAGRWAQLPVPLGFLQDLLRELPGRTVFTHVRLDGAIVGGHFGLVSRGRLLAWQGAARPDLARTHFPTTLLYWGDLGWACERGLDAVDFGGSIGRDSLWDFKRRCGAEPEPRCLYTCRSPLARLAARLRRSSR